MSQNNHKPRKLLSPLEKHSPIRLLFCLNNYAYLIWVSNLSRILLTCSSPTGFLCIWKTVMSFSFCWKQWRRWSQTPFFTCARAVLNPQLPKRRRGLCMRERIQLSKFLTRLIVNPGQFKQAHAVKLSTCFCVHSTATKASLARQGWSAVGIPNLLF